jgi:uncharacterized OB-fold protein
MTESPAKPADGAQPARRVRPLLNTDTAFFWEAVRRGELALQRCAACRTLRYPPAPMCQHCQSLHWQAVNASGRGRVHSFTVVHHPPVPPFAYPNAIALIELEEGVRMISQLVGIAPESIVIGMEVAVSFERVDDDLVLPLFRPLAGSVA